MIATTNRLLLSVGCLLALTLQGHSAEQGRKQERRPQPIDLRPPAPTQTIHIDQADYKMSGPFKQDNLAVYLIHATQETRKDEQFITLDEGLRRGWVHVREKKGGGDVRELVIDNRSDYPLYLQEGDRLSGGKQDRTVQWPMVIAPKSGPQKLPTFCIEQSRWRSSNTENRFASAGSGASAPKSVRAAAKYQGDQSAVWSKVAGVKAEYSRSLASKNSNSSLNESLDGQHARGAAASYTTQLSQLIENQKDVVGVAFAVNGQIEEVNIYSGHPLMAKMFPRLLESYAMEAAVAKNRPAEAEKPAKDEKTEAVKADEKDKAAAAEAEKAEAARKEAIAKAQAAVALKERNTKAAANLKKPLDTKYNGMEFAEVLDDLRGAVGVEFVIDWSAIEESGIKRDKRIVVRVRGTPGDEVLRQVLEFAGGREKDALGYVISDGKVHIGQRNQMAGIANREKQREQHVTVPPTVSKEPVAAKELPPLQHGEAPSLDHIAAFMQGLQEGKSKDQPIDGRNTLQVVELSDRFFARSMVGDVVVHRQWMRAEKK